MMEQDESTDFKTLKAGFEGENGLKIHAKPAIPEKPKTIPPSKVSNPLVSSISAAVRKGELHAPRVVFKDDKNLSRQLSPPWGSKTSDNRSVNNTELVDNNQKKEVDGTPDSESSPRTPVSAIPIRWSTPQKFVFNPQKSIKDNCDQTDHVKGVEVAKKSMKERNLPLVLPVPPRKVETSEPEPSPITPVSAPPSTPKSFAITPQKAIKDENEKADAIKEVSVAKKSMKERNLPLVLPVPPRKVETSEPESSPLTPASAPPSTPKSFAITPQKAIKDENEKADAIKDVSVAKKSMKERNLPLVLPMLPRKVETSEPESSPLTPASAPPSTPKSFAITPQKAIKDENEKADAIKEVSVAKKSMKERNLPLVLPVPPRKVETSEPEPSPLTPVFVPPSTPKSFIFTPQKASNDEDKADTIKEVNVAKKSMKERNLPLVLPTKADIPEPELNPDTHVSNSPIKVSTPKSFVYTTPKPSNGQTDTVDSPIPASRTPASHPSTPAGPSIAASIPAPSIPTFANLEPKILEPKIPDPAIPTQALPKTHTYFPTPSDTEPLKPNINILNLSEVFPPPEGSPPPEFTDIPPPVLDEDFPDGDFFEQAKPTPAIRTFIPPVSRSPEISSLASTPTPSTPLAGSQGSSVKPLDYTSGLNSTVFSPPPEVHTAPTPVDVVLENAKGLAVNTEMIKEDQNSTKPLSALSALARAEEMASVKRAPHDSRVFNLLERAKRKTTASQLATKPEDITPAETVTPEIPLPETPTPPPETVTTEVTQPEVTPPEKALPQLATTVEEPPEETPPVPEVPDIPELPPVDYVDHARLPPKTQKPEPAKVNGLDHRVLTVVKPVHPPPPPPRKALPATPIVDLPLEKPTQNPAPQLQIPIATPEHLETHEGSLHNSSFGEMFYDNDEPEAPSVSTFRPPSVTLPASTPKRPLSVHEEALLKHQNPKHQVKDAVLPNTEEMDYGSMNSGSPNPEIQVPVLKDSVQSSPALSPSGTLERGDDAFEDHMDNKKGKTIKNKKQKGPPKNPYADAAAAVQEAPKKSLFSRKNSGKVADDKELKKKEKQREKEKEKEKEREKKEQKEKEKKDNEIRKKFKITGQEEPIYHVKVIEECKGRKNDLPVKVGETVSIIRTENCPKGKWLAKDSNNTYGYIPVECVDLNINGIMELGKKTTVSNRSSGNGHKDTEAHSTNSRTSEHYDMNHESFSEDSEEWTCDDDDPQFASLDETTHVELNQSQATPAQDPVRQTQTDSTYPNVQAKQEALQKLSTFFMQPKTPSQLPQQNNSPVTLRMSKPKPAHEENPVSLNKEEEEGLDISNLQILPPPDLYADLIAGDSMPIYTKPIKLVPK